VPPSEWPRDGQVLSTAGGWCRVFTDVCRREADLPSQVAGVAECAPADPRLFPIIDIPPGLVGARSVEEHLVEATHIRVRVEQGPDLRFVPMRRHPVVVVPVRDDLTPPCTFSTNKTAKEIHGSEGSTIITLGGSGMPRSWPFRAIGRYTGITRVAPWYCCARERVPLTHPGRVRGTVGAALPAQEMSNHTLPGCVDEVSYKKRPWTLSPRPFVSRGNLARFPDLAALSPATIVADYGQTEVLVTGSEQEQRPSAWTTMTLRRYVEDHVLTEADTQGKPLYISEDEALVEDWGLLPSLRSYVGPLVPRTAHITEESALWLGPPRSRTGLHADPHGFNLLCQLYGTKRVWLIEPRAANDIPRSKRFDDGAKTTDLEFWTTSVATLVAIRARPFTLRRGDVLYIPRWWWHAVENIDISLAVSYRTETPMSLLANVPTVCRRLVHSLGWYQKGNCTCHPPL